MINFRKRATSRFRSHPESTNDLSAWLWFWPPIILYMLAIRTPGLDLEAIDQWLIGERGVIENTTALLAVAAGVTALLVLRYRGQAPRPWLKGWLVMLPIGAFYFAGEELSWGQHWVGWDTPQWIAQHNKQNETNLHNLDGIGWWFNWLPRLSFNLWIAVGGIVAPVLNFVSQKLVPGSSSWGPLFWPTYVCLPTAILTMLTRLPENFQDDAGGSFFFFVTSAGDLKEFFMAIFLLLYVSSMYRRLHAQA